MKKREFKSRSKGRKVDRIKERIQESEVLLKEKKTFE